MPLIDITEQESPNVSIEIQEEKPNREILEAGKTASLVALDQGKDPVEAYMNHTQSGDFESMLSTFNNSVSEDRIKMMNSFVGINPPELIQKDAEDYTKDMSGENGILGPYIQQIKSMPSSVGKSERDIRDLASASLQRQALSLFQPSGIGEGFLDIAGVVWPKRKAATVREVASKLGFVSDTADNLGILIDPTDELDQMRNIGLGLEGDDKASYIDAVVNAVDSSSDNNFIKSEIIDAIFGEGTTPADTVFEMVDLAFVAQMATATAKASAKLYKGASVLNQVRKMGAADLTAEMITRSSADDTVAATLGVSKADIGDALNPTINGELATILEGAPSDMAARAAHMIDLQDARYASVIKLEREGVLDTETAEQVMRAAEIEQMKKPGVVGVKIVSNDETGFKLQWSEQLFDEVGNPRLTASGKPFVTKETRQVDFRLNETGKIESPLDEYSEAINKLDPNARMAGRLRNWFVHTVEKIARIQEKTAFSFDNMMKDAFKGLKKEGAHKVDYVLMQGAKEGKVYNYSELTSGIGANSVKLSDKEALAYVGVRNIVNHMYSLKNKQVVDNFLAMGVRLVDTVDGVIPARVFDDAAKAMKGWKSTSADSHWISVADDGLSSDGVNFTLLKLGKKGELTDEMVEEAYSKGYVLAKNHASSTYFKRGDNKTQWSFVKAENAISPRGQQVIHKIPGYIPKQRTNGYFFIKSNKTGVLSGASKDFKTGETVAWSDSAKSADDWIAAQDDPSKFTKVFDRELTPDQQVMEVTATHGGMYSGARKSTELPFVGEEVAEFADSFEAMQHYINHIGRQYPASLYRLGSEQRLLAVAESIGVKGATGLHNVLGEAIASGIVKHSKKYKMLEDIHDQVSFINMIPTEAERIWADRFLALGKSLEGPILNKIPGWSKVPKFFYNKAAASTHPADLIRGLTFNHLLGMYNPAQILVQFSGAMVSFAVSPIHTLKIMPKALVGWTTLDNMLGDPRAQASMLKWMRTKGGLKEYAEEYELWSKSGYRESVINGNADYTSVFMKNLPYDAGILKSALYNHTIFYKMGELANTRVAFATAIERYKDLKKITHIDASDAKALDAISKDAEALRLNMSRANQSDLNKGMKSVPLQFQQVIAKYFEKLLPRGFGGTDEFTDFEKFRLLAIPTAMTGAVGIPLGQFVMVELLDIMGIDETELSPGQAQLIKFGAIGKTISDFGFNVDLSSRMTLGGDVFKKSLEVFTGNRALWQWLGPSSAVGDRYFRNGQYLAEAFDLSVARNENVDIDSVKFMLSVLKDIAIDTPTLGRNLKQYTSYLLTQNPQFYKDGKHLFDLETMNNRTAIMAIAGFQPTEISEMYEIDKEINDGRSAFSTFGDTDSDVILRVLNTHVLGENLSAEHQNLGAQMVNSIMKKYGPMEAAELMNAVWTKANTKRFDQNDLVVKFGLESHRRIQTGLDFISVTMSRKLQEQRESGRKE